MGSSNENSYYGACRNPWDTARVPGGSSGGSAAAVAAGLAPAATGTDTGGSIRQPAAFCNLTGLKPTYGRVSRFGMIAYASSLDQGGPMARTAHDCALMLNVMAGIDGNDSTSADHPVADYTATLDQPLSGLKIGLPKEFFLNSSTQRLQHLYNRQSKNMKHLAQPLKKSAYRTLLYQCLRTILSLLLRLHLTYRGLTAFVTAIAAATPKISRTCTNAHAARALAQR